jgi:hypothetical protein
MGFDDIFGSSRASKRVNHYDTVHCTLTVPLMQEAQYKTMYVSRMGDPDEERLRFHVLTEDAPVVVGESPVAVWQKADEDYRNMTDNGYRRFHAPASHDVHGLPLSANALIMLYRWVGVYPKGTALVHGDLSNPLQTDSDRMPDNPPPKWPVGIAVYAATKNGMIAMGTLISEPLSKDGKCLVSFGSWQSFNEDQYLQDRLMPVQGKREHAK